MSDIQRYALQTELSEDSLGKWVRYEDHLDEVAWAVSEVLNEAREAVAALPMMKIAGNFPLYDADEVIAAIDALKEKP